MANRESLKPGTIIEYAGMVATVIEDFGGNTLKVIPSDDNDEQNWRWEFDGLTCKVIGFDHEAFGY